MILRQSAIPRPAMDAAGRVQTQDVAATIVRYITNDTTGEPPPQTPIHELHPEPYEWHEEHVGRVVPFMPPLVRFITQWCRSVKTGSIRSGGVYIWNARQASP